MSFLTLLQNRDVVIETTVSIPVAEIELLTSNPTLLNTTEQEESEATGASGVGLSNISVRKHPIEIQIPAAQLSIEAFPPSLEVFRREILIALPHALSRIEALAPDIKLTYYEDTEDFEEIMALLNSII